LKGSTFLWNDKVPTYALKECLDWMFKIRYFIDTDEYLSSENDGGKMAGLKLFILKVLLLLEKKFFPINHNLCRCVIYSQCNFITTGYPSKMEQTEK
jgi:hypothetical protein